MQAAQDRARIGAVEDNERFETAATPYRPTRQGASLLPVQGQLTYAEHMGAVRIRGPALRTAPPSGGQAVRALCFVGASSMKSKLDSVEF